MFVKVCFFVIHCNKFKMVCIMMMHFYRHAVKENLLFRLLLYNLQVFVWCFLYWNKRKIPTNHPNFPNFRFCTLSLRILKIFRKISVKNICYAIYVTNEGTDALPTPVANCSVCCLPPSSIYSIYQRKHIWFAYDERKYPFGFHSIQNFLYFDR